MQSPCNTCDYKARDKKHWDCVNCDLRVRYAVKLGILHPEVLRKQDDPLVLEAREKALDRKPRSGRPRGSAKKKEKCSEDGCNEWAVAKGKCRTHYNKAYQEAKKVKEGGGIVTVKKEEKRCKCKPGCTAKIKARGMCDTSYSRWKHQNPDKVRPYSKVANGEKVTVFDVRLQARGDGKKYELLQKTAEIAALKYRTVQNQIFFWMKEGIERYNKVE